MTIKYCKCGCGKELIQKYKWYIPKYIPGHNGRGERRSEESKLKIGLSRKGKEHSEETKKKQSELMKEWHKNNPHPRGFLGKKRTEEYLKNRSELFSGDKNPNWQGGKSFEPYTKEFNNKFKKTIRKRDNYICLKCGKHQEMERKALTIHHINYDKQLTIPQNCCTICNKCNGEVNFNRKHWIKFFQSLLSEKYGYNYSENQEIKLEIKYDRN